MVSDFRGNDIWKVNYGILIVMRIEANENSDIDIMAFLEIILEKEFGIIQKFRLKDLFLKTYL